MAIHLKVHLQKHEADKVQYNFDFCVMTFKNKDKLRKHMDYHHPKVIYQCDICESTFNFPSVLKQHFKMVHDRKTVKCDICGKEVRKYCLKKHKQYFHKENKQIFKCEPCDKESTQEEYLKSHERTQHYKLGKCKYCSKLFGLGRSLNQHLEVVHGKSQRVKCHLCNNELSNKGQLPRHIKTVHEKIKNHKCNACDKTFFNNKDLKIHTEGVHSGMRNYPCDACAKSYTNKANLVRHKRESHSKNSFKCDTCDMEFVSKSNLQNHVDGIHNDVKNFECDICKKRFVLNNHLSRHKREVHFTKKVEKRKKNLTQHAQVNQKQRDGVKNEFEDDPNILIYSKVEIDIQYDATQNVPIKYMKTIVQPNSNPKEISNTNLDTDVKNEVEDGQIQVHSKSIQPMLQYRIEETVE